MIGWSHGGLISLMNIFAHPDDYRCAYAGVPVSDLIARLGYLDDDYRALYSADYHIGQTVTENIEEYKRRSPRLERGQAADTPVDPHQHQRRGRQRARGGEPDQGPEGRRQGLRVRDLPGRARAGTASTGWTGREAQEIRLKVYAFLARHLDPPRPLTDLKQLHAAGYRTPEGR